MLIMTSPFSTSNLEPLVALFLFLLMGCTSSAQRQQPEEIPDSPYLVVLGVAQDAGYPQAGQQKEWELVKSGKVAQQHVVCLGLVDPIS